ncbi:MAG: conjugative transfer signal peptidase TraF [Burkholderiaceae bacterium]
MTSMPFLRFMACVVCLLFISLTALGLGGYRWNSSTSAPVGLWRLVHSDPNAIRVGDYVLLCPPNHAELAKLARAHILPIGQCAPGIAPFLKQVVALSGSQFSVNDDGITLDGKLIANTKPVDYGSLTIAAATIVPPRHIVAVQSMHPRSIDSRYFGPISIERIQGVVVPKWLAQTGY